MKEMMIILFSAILTENFILAKFMGILPLLGRFKAGFCRGNERGRNLCYGHGHLQLPGPSTLTCWFPMGWITSDGGVHPWSLRPWYSWWRSS